MQLGDWLLRDEVTWPDELTASNHHLGTTRMADDPRQGVVDRDGRVFGCDNLYVAGSSVFPTGGFANPTVNLVALTLRLAEHLRTRLSEPLPERAAPWRTSARSDGAWPTAVVADVAGAARRRSRHVPARLVRSTEPRPRTGSRAASGLSWVCRRKNSQRGVVSVITTLTVTRSAGRDQAVEELHAVERLVGLEALGEAVGAERPTGVARLAERQAVAERAGVVEELAQLEIEQRPGLLGRDCARP